jgi:hypothetical protein
LPILAPAVSANFQASGSAQVTGQVGLGTTIPRAQFEVHLSSSDAYAIQVSSENGAPMLQMDNSGKLAIGLSSAQADVDVTGTGDSGSAGLELRCGNSSSTLSSSQIVFTSSSNAYAHSIRTRAVAGQNLYNSIDFFLWNSTAQPSALGSLYALSLQATTTISTGTASVHVMPVSSAPVAELEVSNGVSLGGGTIEYASSMPPGSSRSIKSDIEYLGPEKATQAYEDIKSLRHATYRYKRLLPGPTLDQTILVDDPSGPLHRGLIYEDAPASIQGEHKTLVVDYRVMNMELALKEIDGRIKELEARIASIEKAKKKAKRRK